MCNDGLLQVREYAQRLELISGLYFFRGPLPTDQLYLGSQDQITGNKQSLLNGPRVILFTIVNLDLVPTVKIAIGFQDIVFFLPHRNILHTDIIEMERSILFNITKLVSAL